MITSTECSILADTFESVRSLSKRFLSMVDESLIHDTTIFNGVELNSPYWITAHLAWAEAFLILNTFGGEEEAKYEWLNEYGFGTKPAEIKTKPPYEEVTKAMDYIHELAMKQLRNTEDSFLDQKNKFGMKFDGKDNNRIAVHHAIRHEPMHIGQLTWFMKSKGLPTF
jgi:hypothetical protein